MSDERDVQRLAALGIHEASDALDPGVRAECARVARRLILGGTRVVGLLPATHQTAVPPIAVQLGLAVCALSGGTAAVVDANLRWPALAQAIESSPARDGRGGDDSVFATRWLHGQLALLAPTEAGAAGAGLPELARLIHSGAELFPMIFADLTGFDVLGEHLGAMDVCEGILLVARAAEINERTLLERHGEIPAAKRLGVLLLGGRTLDGDLALRTHRKDRHA